jgi:hypothetical protein
MNATEPKPLDEILDSLADARKVFLVGCTGCPVGCDCGGPPWVEQMTAALEQAGKQITGSCLIDLLCNKALVGVKLGRVLEPVLAADALVVGACGVGVQAVGNMVTRRAVPALNTVCLGETQGLWPGEERCGECGECLLAYTGGLCPITLCAKSLVNGQCGGTNDDGSCEVSAEHPCGWKKIYDRLKELGRLDDLRRMNAPRDYRKQTIPDAARRTTRYALEVAEQEEAAEAEAPGK